MQDVLRFCSTATKIKKIRKMWGIFENFKNITIYQLKITKFSR